ncbi:hypothetical protein ACQJBY_068679 [Aegilops geniculata]
MARQLEGGHDHLAEMVQAVKNHGAGALHFTAGCKMVEVCEYLLRMSRWTCMSLTKQVKAKAVFIESDDVPASCCRKQGKRLQVSTST